MKQTEGIFGMQCPQCKQGIKVASTNTLLEEQAIAYAKQVPIHWMNDFTKSDEIWLILTVVTCPECAHDIVVQLDTPETQEKLKEQVKVIAEVSAMRRTQNPTKKYLKSRQERRRELDRELTEMRADILLNWSGETVIDPNGKTYKLDMYIPTEANNDV